MSATTASQPTPAHQLRDAQRSDSGVDVVKDPQDNSSFKSSGPVESTLFFFDPPADGEKPYNWAGAYADNPPNGKKNNFGIDEHKVTLADIRGQESSFSLDKSAFAAIPDVSSDMSYEDWNNDETIQQVYYPEVERLLLDNVEGAHKIVLFDHTIRKPNHNRAPVQRVHIDQTAKSTEARVRFHIPGQEAEELLQGRYRIINVWRPLNGPVKKHPLAVADSATVRDEDLIPVEHRYPDRTGETAGVRFNEGQKWYYWSEMGNDDRLFLKCYDSDAVKSPKGRVPHTAFDNGAPEGAPERESIEVRALVFG